MSAKPFLPPKAGIFGVADPPPNSRHDLDDSRQHQAQPEKRPPKVRHFSAKPKTAPKRLFFGDLGRPSKGVGVSVVQRVVHSNTD